jgi:CelD/BcsL family acetyltransferase involved in cellulose biosynthesis
MRVASTTVDIQPDVLEVQAYPAREWRHVAPLWAELFEAASFSFFMSPDWINTWMSVFGPLLEPVILVFRDGASVQGACLVVESNIRAGVLTFRRISLNAAGESASEATYGEFNDLVCRPGAEAAVARALAGYLSARNWDELLLTGFEPGTGYDLLRRHFADLAWEEDRRPSYYVDLNAIRGSGGRFESVLGKSTRKRVRQNRRHFSAEAPLTLEQAESVARALSMFEELASLNRDRREGLGGTSVFEADRFLEFHRRLIATSFGNNAIRFVRVATQDRTIGIVYLYELRGKVYFYQCGFHFESDSQWSPGTLTVAESIENCLDAGHAEYDFLAGDAGYKERLSTASRTLVWASGRKRTRKMELIQGLRKVQQATVGTYCATK